MTARTAPARFVRFVQPGERIVDLIAEGKPATWVDEAEYAIVSLVPVGSGKKTRVVVKGGRDGIEFMERNGQLWLELEGKQVAIRRVLGHTHPRVTGPSQGDREALRFLRQTRSYIVEIGGDSHATLIRPD